MALYEIALYASLAGQMNNIKVVQGILIAIALLLVASVLIDYYLDHTPIDFYSIGLAFLIFGETYHPEKYLQKISLRAVFLPEDRESDLGDLLSLFGLFIIIMTFLSRLVLG